jgi:hypothetical protein
MKQTGSFSAFTANHLKYQPFFGCNLLITATSSIIAAISSIMRKPDAILIVLETALILVVLSPKFKLRV